MISEADLAAETAKHFEERGWTCHYEVQLSPELRPSYPQVGDGRADIVVTNDKHIGVIECKLGLGLEVFSQARRWFGLANCIWIAIREGEMTDARREGIAICRDWYKAGLVELTSRGMNELCLPAVRTVDSTALYDSLRPEHRTHARPGTNRGGQFTEWRGTAEALAAYVAVVSGCKLSEAVREIKHHYHSDSVAETFLEKAIRKGEIHGVFWGRRQRLFSTEEDAKRGFSMGSP
jgi:hypothetical protein